MGPESGIGFHAPQIGFWILTGTVLSPADSSWTLSVPDEAYGAGWNASTGVPTKNAIYDKIESVIASIPSAYTDEQAQDAVGTMVDATLTYVDGTPSLGVAANQKISSFGITIDGGGSAITTGSKGFIIVPQSMTITGWTIVSDLSGSIVIDIKKSTYANFPTTATIAGSEKPTLSTAQKNQDLSLSSWTTSVTAGDIIEFVVDSITTVTRINLVIQGTKS